MTDIADAIEAEVANAVDNDQLDLPTLPEVALRIRDEAESDGVTANTLAKVMRVDAALSARLIKVANSPMFRAPRTIDDLTTAISRLGLDYSANLATGLAMQNMFQATSELIDRQLRQTWVQATEVAAISGVLARLCKLKVDQATLAGLTHNIGVLPILTWAEDNDHLLNDSVTLAKVIEGIHGSLGTMILQSWDFPDDIARVPTHYNNFSAEETAPSYTATVRVAILESQAGRHEALASIDKTTISAYQAVRFDRRDSTDVAEFMERVEEAKAAFA